MIDVKCEHSEQVDPKKLLDHPGNPNKHPSKQIELLAKSIQTYGWRHPIVVSKRSGYIVAGHGRKAAALNLDCSTVPVDYQDFKSEEEELAVLLADNILPELATMDDALLEVGKFTLLEAGFELESIGVPELSFDDINQVEPPDLPDGERAPFQQMTFTLHDSQVEIVKGAIDKAKKAGQGESNINDNSNGNALSFICGEYGIS